MLVAKLPRAKSERSCVGRAATPPVCGLWLCIAWLCFGHGCAGGRGDATDAGLADGGDGGDAGLELVGRCRDQAPLRRAFFGDTHVHTALSLDANLQGTLLRPMDAYRFARGEEVGIQPYDDQGRAQRTLRLERPLDFAVLSDHAEFLGHVRTCNDSAYEGYDSDVCRQYRDDPQRSFFTLNSATASSQSGAEAPGPCADGDSCEVAIEAAWQEVQEAAAAALDTSDRCEFTSFVGYEWTANPGTQNLHRNVIFRSDRVPAGPVSYFDAGQEEQLWERLRQDCEQGVVGCRVLTIPHNSNLSAGLMFEEVNGAGEPFDAAYAQLRAHMEPVAEVFQHKGSSECYSPTGTDEACGFEIMPYNTLASATLGPEMPSQLTESDYLRNALLQGLALRRSLGVNPFAYGLVGSTDTHLGTPGAVDERSFPGHGGAGRAARGELPPGLLDNIWFNPGGLAGVWAEENSRPALFDAMRRREVFGTSGPRIQVRFFAGFDYPTDLCGQTDRIERAYAGGVPMGAELASQAGSLRFFVAAQRDPGTEAQSGTLLSHVEIIKGWLDGDSLRTRVVQVAGDPDSGARVDTATCEPSGPGADELCAVWEDEEYASAQLAFYYARVFENPTCRWHAHACNAGGVKCDEPQTITAGFEPCCDEAYPRTQRERAWTSPVWLVE